MDTDSSFLVSKVVNEIRSVFGFEEANVQSMVEIGRNTETTAEEFYLRSKEFLPRVPLKCVLSIFDTIRENFHPKPKNSAAGSDLPEVGKIYGGKFTDLKPTTNVFVKVLSISNKDSINLSTKGVDQKTGQELETTKKIKRESLNPETIRIEMNESLSDFLQLMIKKSGGKISPAVENDFQLYYLGAINKNMEQTDLGKKMAKFFVGPVLSRILMAGVDFQCSREALIIVAMIAAGPTYFERPREVERRVVADRKMAGFFQPGGDHLTLLAVFKAWEENKFRVKWCFDNFVYLQSLTRARELRDKLADIISGMRLEIFRTKNDNPMIRKAITAGLCSRSCRWDPQEDCYRTLFDEKRRVHIHPRSALFREQRPRFVVHDAICMGEDNKEYMMGVTVIDPKWLVELAPRFFIERRVPQGRRR